MIAFLIQLLWFLLYAGLVYLIVWFLLWAFEQLLGKPVQPRPRQIIYAVVAILLVIWLLGSLSGHTPILPPWEWSKPGR